MHKHLSGHVRTSQTHHAALMYTTKDTEDTEMHFNEISGEVVDSAMRVHSALGPGLLENVYLVCLVHELNQRGLRTATQLPLPVR